MDFQTEVLGHPAGPGALAAVTAGLASLLLVRGSGARARVTETTLPSQVTAGAESRVRSE